MLKAIGRVLVLLACVLVILLSVAGIIGAWWVNSIASGVTLKVFSVVQGGVEIIDTAAGRVDTLLQTTRNEVQQAAGTITTIASNLQENHPILTALSDRLQTRLGPGISTIQEAMAPVHDALVTVGSAVSFANSIPFIQERAPRLDQLDQTFTRLGTLAADVQQLSSTLKAATEAGADQLTQTAATALTDLTSRIDAGLADIQTSVQALQSDITALQARLQERQSQLLLIYNLAALAVTFLLMWVIYSQVVVVRYHWSRSRRAAAKPVSPTPVVATAGAETVAPPPAEMTAGQTVEPSEAVSVAPAKSNDKAQPEIGSDAAAPTEKDAAEKV